MSIIYTFYYLGSGINVFLSQTDSMSILFWILLLIVYIQLSEGQLVQQIYFKTGKIEFENNLFVFKNVFFPIVLWLGLQIFILVVLLITV